MGIPTSAFQAGDLYIEYGFEEVLFRYEKRTGRFFCKFYSDFFETERPHDDKLLCDAQLSGVLTTAKRYSSGGAPVADAAAGSFARAAVKYQRVRPYWLSVMYQKDYTRAGDIEVRPDSGLEIIKAAAPIEELLEKLVSDINSRAFLDVIYGKGAPIKVDKSSGDYEFALRLELKEREFTVISESSYYRGRSSS